MYLHAAGYGSDGPYAGRALYAQAAQAVAGSFGRQVGYWAQPEQNLGMNVMEMQAVVVPRLNQVVDGDANPALVVLVAVLLGLFHQRRTGNGQFIRTSMIGANAWCYSDDFCAYAGKPSVPRCDSEYFGISALERLYSAESGWVCLVVRTDHEWRALTGAIGLPELAVDPRFAVAADRRINDGLLAELLGARFLDKSAATWEAVLSDLDVGCVQADLRGYPAFISFDLGLRQAGLTVEIDTPHFGPMVVWGPPVAFSETPGRVGQPCTRGEHNRSILTEFGYSDKEIDGLEAAGVVVLPDPVP